MHIHSLYRNFFCFLEEISSPSKRQSEKWPLYFESYYQPNKEFLDTYFTRFPLLDNAALKQRVEAIKPSDYSLLLSLVELSPPEKLIKSAYDKCLRIVSPPQEPEVYLFIGFFSADGFVMHFRQKPVICFGLERFRDFRLFRVLFAHEYVHFLLNITKPEIAVEHDIQWTILSEGLSTCFSSIVLPHLPLAEHFFFRRDMLNWCQANEVFLRGIFCSEELSSQELMEFYAKGNPELSLPPRAAKYLGFQAVKRWLVQNRGSDIAALILNKNLLQSLKI